MYRLMSRAVIALIVLAAASVSSFAQGMPSWSFWTNQRGSYMKIFNVEPSGKFTGLYVNNAPGYPCQGLPGFALNGRSTGSNVTFTVHWNNGIQNCNSTTTWTGVINGRSLPTSWILWGPHGIQRGHDLFTQQ
jgi:hypothetical protein